MRSSEVMVAGCCSLIDWHRDRPFANSSNNVPIWTGNGPVH